MSTHKHVLSMALAMLIMLAALTRLDIVLAAPRSAMSDWKLPLPAGEYIVVQGDQDSCYVTHCRSYQYGNQNTYCAIDLDLRPGNIEGLPVLAPANGKVIDVNYQEYGGGNYVYIQHEDGVVSHYEHLLTVYVNKGDELKQGEPFGRVGKTGGNWGPHLHFTVKNGRHGNCVKITSLDGNTNFKTNARVKSSNVQVGNLPDERIVPVPSAPPVPPAQPLSGVPNRPTLAEPLNSSSMAQNTDVTLRWNNANNATQYKVELWGGQYSSTMVPCDWQSGTSCHIGRMWPGTMSWHVKARNSSSQESDWSDTWTFTIQGPTEMPATKTSTPPPQAPAAPTLQEPPNEVSYTQSQDIWFAWNYVPNADQYYLEYWGGPYGTLNSGWINDVAYHIGTMWPGTYHWHVKSRGHNGVESNWSGTWSFTIQATTQPTETPVLPTVPASANSPTLSSPENGSSWPQSADITLVWNAASNAKRYKVELWGGPYSTMTPCDWQSETSCHIGQMWPGKMYWHVKARNSSGQESEWSDTWSFTIQEAQVPTDTPRPSFTGNIAPQANRSPDGIGSGNAFDGDLSTFWTDGLGHRFTLTLSLPGLFDVSRILVWDRPQNSPDNQQINQLIVSLSNGWSKRFDMISGGPRCIDVTLSSPQTISSVMLKVEDGSGNNGLSEVEIWVGAKSGGPTCSNRGTMP